VKAVPSFSRKLPFAFLKANSPSRVTKPKTSRTMWPDTWRSELSSPSKSKVTSGVDEPVATANAVPVWLPPASKSSTGAPNVRSLVLLTAR